MAKRFIENRIRRFRFEAGEMTQQQLAEKVGVTRQTILTIESGKYTPSLELAFRLARCFGVPIEELFSFHEEGRTTKEEK